MLYLEEVKISKTTKKEESKSFRPRLIKLNFAGKKKTNKERVKKQRNRIFSSISSSAII